MKFAHKLLAIGSLVCAAAVSSQATAAPILSDESISSSGLSTYLTIGSAYETTFRAAASGTTFSSVSLYSISGLTETLLTPANSIPLGSRNISTFHNLASGDYVLRAFTTGSGLFTLTASSNVALDLTPTAVPEPESLALALAGLAVAGTLVSRRKRA